MKISGEYALIGAEHIGTTPMKDSKESEISVPSVNGVRVIND